MNKPILKQPNFTGVWIPASVLIQPISINAKVCYGVIDGLDNEDGCFASNAYLKAFLGLETRQLQNILKELDDHNLIARQVWGEKRIIRTVEKVALVSAIASANGGCKKLHGGVQKTAQGACTGLHTDSKDDNKEDKDTPQTPKGAIEKMPEGGNPLPFESVEFSKAWFRWVDYRKQIRRALKQPTVDEQWSQFKKWGERKSIDSIRNSIANGWTGLFEGSNYTNQKQPLTADDHDNGF